MEILKSNIYEVKKTGSLKTLGGLLALFHVMLFIYWAHEGALPIKLAAQDQPMCWPFMENCGWMHLPAGIISVLYYSYAVFAALAALVLILTDWVAFGIYLLNIAFVLALGLYFQDLRLSTNEGYFILLLSFSYLYLPSKHRLMRWLIVSFFVARGLSQATADWLTGSWYLEHLSLPVKFAEWLAAVSVLAQMIGAAALLFRDGRYFFTGWLCVFVYECTHLYIGEFLEGSLALGALVYLLLDEMELRKRDREYIYQSFIRPEPSFIWGGALLALFWAAQLTPFISLPRQSALRGILNVWALHPEAAHDECEQKTFAIYKNRVEEIEIEPALARQPAMYCNPYLRYLDLKGACQQMKTNPEFVTLSSAFQVRNLREKNSYRAFEVKDFCTADLTFKQLSEVRWTTSHAK